MAHSKTFIDPRAAFSVARVAAVTGNPMLDVGYQARDSRPFFTFSRMSSASAQDAGDISTIPTYYTTLHPARCTQNTTVNIYEMSSRVVDGVAYNDMKYAGTGVQNGQTLTVVGREYTNTNFAYVDIRLHKVNKWSVHKPIAQAYYTDRTAEDMYNGSGADEPYGLSCPVVTGWHLIEKATYAYVGVPQPEGHFRITDFAGYLHTAACTLSGRVAVNGSAVDVTLTHTYALASSGIIRIHDIVWCLRQGTVELTDCYPCVLARYASNSNRGYVRKLESDDSTDGRFVLTPQETHWTADLSGIPLWTGGSAMVLSVFLIDRLTAQGLYDLNDWQQVDLINPTALVGNLFTVPGAVGIESVTEDMSAPRMSFSLIGGPALNIGLNFSEEHTQTMHYSISARVGSGGTSQTKTGSMAVGTTLRLVAFAWADLGIAVAPGMTVTGIRVTGQTWYDEDIKTAAVPVIDGSVSV